ncbi:MAG: hypothetical protein ACKPJJ_31270, partial [Planctomycetaceae bacterium]
MSAFKDLERKISDAMHADQFGMRQLLRSITAAEKAGRPFDRLMEKLQGQLNRSLQRKQHRAAWRPQLQWDPELPVVARRQEVMETIAASQVVVLCGETGSGKSTQLPKILTEMGRGIAGVIG